MEKAKRNRLILWGLIAYGAIVVIVTLSMKIGRKQDPSGLRYVMTEKCTSVINLRQLATTQSPSMALIPYADQVSVLPGNKSESEFWRVEYLGMQGFVAVRYLSQEDPDSLFLQKQKNCASVNLYTAYNGRIGKNSKVELHLNQFENDLDGTAVIEWRKSGGKGELISTLTNVVKGRIDYCDQSVELGEPRNALNGRFSLTLTSGSDQLVGKYYKYDGSAEWDVNLNYNIAKK